MSRSVMGRVIDAVMRKAGNLATSPSERRPANAPVVEVDVRDTLRGGGEPFARIMKAVSALGDDEVLRVRAIFEPVPLIVLMGKRGFAHESTMHSEDDWSVWFWRTTSPVEPPPPVAAAEAEEAFVDDERTVHVDVRALEPPEPMRRTLVMLQSLPRGCTLVQINRRVPQFLLPVLAERGFAWEIDETGPGRVLVRIWRAE